MYSFIWFAYWVPIYYYLNKTNQEMEKEFMKRNPINPMRIYLP